MPGEASVERGRVSVCLLCFVLVAFASAVLVAPAPLTAWARGSAAKTVEKTDRVSGLRTSAMVRGLSAGQSAPEHLLDSCLGEKQTPGDDGVARIDPVRCALPRSDDKPSTSTPAPNAGTTTPPSPDTAGTAQPSTAGATQPTASGAPQPGTTPPVTTPAFAYYPPGDLDPHDSTRGRKGDRKVYLPNIIFPLRLAPDQHPHMNSQIWGHGGGGWNGKGEAGGAECDPANYDPMQQRDTYCEVRSWAMPMCPGGAGHQGQDIRPPTCKNNTWEAVAVVDGVITQVTTNTTVRLKGGDGTDYLYLHMHPQSITVKVGQTVKQGDVLGHVSKYMDGDPNGTTMHLHFQVRQTIRVDGKILSVYIPGYTSLIAAYRKSKGLDPGIGPDGNLIVDAQLEIGAPKPPQPVPSPQPPAPGPASQPPAPPAPDQPAPGPAPQPPAPGPAPTSPAPGPDQPAPSPQSPTPCPAPQPPAPPASGPDQPASGPQPPVATPGPAPQPPTSPPSTADQPAPSPQPPAPPPGPAPPPPGPTPPTPAPTPPAPSVDQPASSPPPTVSPPPPNQPAAQPPQAWWQKAWDSTKEWWSKAGK
jgi:murein DD-endopeptidase MepM/ murein hydrolase activator NlpD